ncbi:MAG: type II toxin-antitoxin system RelE/ParE family toxin [Cyanobacteria bacterium]|nr:type II toxin-antitoxin system RelE/ParE family toxin [Cyanobacteriota bacterium]
MNIEYLPTFIKDFKALRGSPIYKTIYQLAFEDIPNADSLSELSNLKKLKGSSTAYRIRVGNYRIGIFITNEKIQFSRILHRREIYRYFP